MRKPLNRLRSPLKDRMRRSCWHCENKLKLELKSNLANRYTEAKAGKQKGFVSVFNNSGGFDGQLLHILAKTGEKSYLAYSLWESEEKMVSAPHIFSLLSNTSYLAEELLPELGVTDLVSGRVLFKNID